MLNNYQIKWDYECSNIVANIFPADPDPGQNSTFSEYGHVAYQIKGNDTCSNKVENILPVDSPPQTLEVGSKF